MVKPKLIFAVPTTHEQQRELLKENAKQNSEMSTFCPKT